jgi:hypothetical protein
MHLGHERRHHARCRLVREQLHFGKDRTRGADAHQTLGEQAAEFGVRVQCAGVADADPRSCAGEPRGSGKLTSARIHDLRPLALV